MSGFVRIGNEFVDEWMADLPPRAVLVYMALARFADRDGVCYPSYSTVARLAGVSRRSVMRNIAILTARGLIAVTRGGHGPASTNTYRLTIKGDTGDTLKGDKGDNRDQLRVTPVTDKGDTGVTRIRPRTRPIEQCGKSQLPVATLPPATLPPVADITFDDFWDAYPRRGGRRRFKKTASDKFKKIKAADLPALMAATANYADECGDFAMDAKRFLANDEWRAYVDAPTNEVADRLSDILKKGAI